jgi:phosphinothricin acetyltransferase
LPIEVAGGVVIMVMVTLHAVTQSDWREVRDIYAEGLATGLAAFMTKPPLWKAWDAGYLPFGRLLARRADGEALGWGALRPVPDA